METVKRKENLKFEFYYRPGLYLSVHQRKLLLGELKTVTDECFEQTPDYQILTGEVHEWERSVLVVARDRSDKIMGFCSSLLLPIENMGEVLHLGLTCVSLKARGLGLTHKLTSKLLLNLLTKHLPLQGIWVSNVACVVSSLGNVAQYFEDIYPGPYSRRGPSAIHTQIAKTLSKSYRRPLAINQDAEFDPERFVFKGSVAGSVFQKCSQDSKYHHRKRQITDFYLRHMDIDAGDEVLQIGRVSLLTFPKYLLKKFAPIRPVAEIPVTS